MLQDKIIEIALSHLGEHESGEGNTNEGDIIDWSFKNWTSRKPEDGTHWASWCAGFVSTCILAALQELKLDIKDWKKRGSLSVSSLYNKNKDWFIKDNPSKGDIILFAHDTDLYHTGLIKEVSDSIKTIEGNSNNAVSRREYKKEDTRIFGFIKIQYK